MRFAAFFILLSTLAANAAAAEELAGRWEGSFRIPGQEFNLIADLDRSDGKSWIGSIIIPGLGVKGAPLADLAVDGSKISFTIKGALASEQVGQAKFKGQLNAAGELRGNFLQAGNSAPFVLRKTGPAEVELPPKSTALSKEIEGEWKGDYEMDGYTRHVTLTLANQPTGGGDAQLVIVGKRTTKVPVDLVTQQGDFLALEAHQFGVTYEGRLAKDADEITGSITLGPFERPLVLRHGEKTK